MARRKNVKRIDPRYFMDEKTDAPSARLEELMDPPSFSPLSSTKPGERIPEPGSRRPLENRREIPAALQRMQEELASTRAAVDKTIEWLQRYDKQDHWEALNSIIYRTDEDHNPFYDIHKNLDALDATLGKLQGSTAHDDPRAPKLEE